MRPLDPRSRWRVEADRHAAVRHVLLALCLVIVAGSAPSRAVSDSPTRALDDFVDVSPWTAVASDGAQASIHPAEGVDGRALRLDFDLAGTAGYAAARRPLPLDLPPRYEISFYVRGDAPVNDLQLKLVDASGENVWWLNRRDFEFPQQWRLVRVKSSQIQFAWGPTADRVPRHIATVELVVAAGRGGGRGSVYVSQLRLRELPEESTAQIRPVVSASSSAPGAGAALALDGTTATAWKSDPVAGRAQQLTIDFRRPREVGGLIVHWLASAYASRYDVELSDDGSRWQTVARITRGTGGPDALPLPDAETRFLRLALHDGPAGAYGVAELEIKDAAFGASPNALFEALARESPRGVYPRAFSGEQVYWTLVGVDGGRESALMSEDGAVEVAKGAFSIEPFVVEGSRVVTWADVETRQSLARGELPIPTVAWTRPEWELRVSSFATVTQTRAVLVLRYQFRNLSDHPLPLELVLAVRPFQVNPPTQFLGTVGGVSPIHDIEWDGTALSVDAKRKVFPLHRPDRVGVFPFEAGPIPRALASANWASAHAMHDDFGFASAALGYRINLAANGRKTVGLVVPQSGGFVAPDLSRQTPIAWMDREQSATDIAWREKVGRVTIRVPPAAQPLIATLHTALTHILMSRDGPALRPGTRSYARSWIRDGAMMAESLLRLGHADAAIEYLRWYAPHQFADGKVPCCVDARGPDPVAENDSPGELIFLAAETYRYSDDRPLMEETWPRLDTAARYLDTLRLRERTDANLRPETHAFYGILPASISHEGYAAKPMHSYWDDFWALKGYDGALAIATALDRPDAARRLEASRSEFRRDLTASLQAAATTHGIAFLPGSAELGDFDPTSTTIAFAPAGDRSVLPSGLILPTYERYWKEFVARRDGAATWEVYSPYELRTVGTFLRLGWRDRAHELLAFFMEGRRPAAWNQWAEIVGRDPRRPRFIGDMPHGWVASDFIRSVLDLFAYERDPDRALVLAAGVPSEWLDEPGVAVQNLRTPHGQLSYSLKRQGSRVVLEVAGGIRMPSGGLVFVWPGKLPPPADTRVDGQPASWRGAELRLDHAPATVVAVEGQR